MGRGLEVWVGEREGSDSDGYSHGDGFWGVVGGGNSHLGGGGRGGRGGAEEAVEAVEERPAGEQPGGNFGLLDLVLLLDGVDAILALNIGLRRLGVIIATANNVGNLLPVLLLEISSA